MEAAIDRTMQTYALLKNSSAAATESARAKKSGQLRLVADSYLLRGSSAGLM
jgi:hypothetical protein